MVASVGRMTNEDVLADDAGRELVWESDSEKCF